MAKEVVGVILYNHPAYGYYTEKYTGDSNPSDRGSFDGGHPVLRWMMDNIFIKTDPAGNIKPDKEKSAEKIGGAVATIMALDRAIRNKGISGSVYDNR
jgi:hypothetical protein